MCAKMDLPVFPVQKFNTPYGGQIHYTDTAAGEFSDRGGLQFSSCVWCSNHFVFLFSVDANSKEVGP